ncbi:MAG TPA: serine/threonine-protein kinase, partial [Planctomycetota bacterium]|nr:serine/threonine-protein kinase [Planctomycetota bacterium]
MTRIVDHGNHDGAPWFAMEKVPGVSLARCIEARAKEGPVASDPAWRDWCLGIAIQVASALAHAHERGVVHRDVKPSNVLVDGDRAWLTDFGLAFVDSDDRLTKSTSELGSLPYLPPECLQGSRTIPNARQDVYALAVSLLEALTLRNPFLAGGATQTRDRITAGIRPAALRGLEPDLALVLQTALDIDPRRRYATVRDFERDLRAVRDHGPILARKTPVSLRVRRWLARHPSVAFAGVFIALTAIVGSFVVASLERSSRLRTEAESERARSLGYVANITAAHVEYAKSCNPIAARERLLACDAKLRGFEWYLLAAATAPSGRAFPGHEGGVRSFCWSEDSTHIASLSMALELTVFDVQSAAIVHRLPAHGGTRVRMWPGRNAFIVDTPDGSIEMRSFQDGSITRTFELGKVPAVAMCFTRDGSRLLVALEDRRLISIEFSSEYEACIEPIGIASRHVTELACGDAHFAVAHLGAEVELWKW